MVLSDSAGIHSWLSAILVRRLHLSRKKVDLTLNGFKATDMTWSELVEVTIFADISDTDYTFNVIARLEGKINIESQNVDTPALQQVYTHLEPIEPDRYCYSDIKIVVGQVFYRHIRALGYIQDEERKDPMAVRLPVGGVLSGPFTSSFGLSSTCCKCNVENVDFASQFKASFELKFYGTYK